MLKAHKAISGLMQFGRTRNKYDHLIMEFNWHIHQDMGAADVQCVHVCCVYMCVARKG